MPTPSEMAEAVAAAPTWSTRIALIRRVPEEYGTAQQPFVYAAIAGRVYVPTLKADFAYVHWREDYELPTIRAAYQLAGDGTNGFTRVTPDDIARVILEHPETLRVFRLLLGFTIPEFAEACTLVAMKFTLPAVSRSTVGTIESGGQIAPNVARTCAVAVDLVMSRDVDLFPQPPAGSALRLKIEKPDTAEGWETVRRYATQGVPLAVLLHQRVYGGAFRQLLDATSTDRGGLIEEPVENLLQHHGVPYIRTGEHNQAAIEQRLA